jgi:hypothetical protein
LVVLTQIFPLYASHPAVKYMYQASLAHISTLGFQIISKLSDPAAQDA